MSKLKGKHPAFPVENANGDIYSGLTVREEFAKAAMEGFIAAQTASFDMWPSPAQTAIYAVEYADTLIAVLNEEEE